MEQLLTILVADDEPELLDAVCRLIDWESIGFRLVGRAGNGLDALQLVEELQPDFLLTDIRMPFISGTALTRQAKAVIAVTAMQYAVGHWNSWFSAFLYLSDDKKYPLQMMLRRILVMNQIKASDYVDEETLVAMEGMADLLKYSLIVVATVPILCAYPFIQKYFVKGIMIGSLKG